MIIQDVINSLEELAPLKNAEDFDNVGLLVGNKKDIVTGILITLDTLEEVVDEAIRRKCSLIVSFHPIVFSGIKKFNGQDYVNRTIIKAIKNNIAIYAIHTALDNVFGGVNDKICDQLGLMGREILIPKTNSILKLATYVPKNEAEQLRTILFKAGAGTIGNYSNCSFNALGESTFKGNSNSNPVLGERNKLHKEEEVQINVVFEKRLQSNILKTLFENHSYEEVAYEITRLENVNQSVGMGMVGKLPKPMDNKSFLSFVKKTMNTDCIRHTNHVNKPIQKVAVLGGSGSFAINAAKNYGADAYITSDIKYHEFYKAENQMLLCDIGHYESEQFTKTLLFDFLTEKFRNFAVLLSGINTNPINYF